MIIIDGKKVSADIKNEIKAEVASIAAQDKYGVHLAVIIVGEVAASKIYVNNKIKACNEVGIISHHYQLDENVTASELIELIEKLNSNISINGILVQLPLPKHIDESKVLAKIDVNKDVDGFSAYQLGKLFLGDNQLVSCTPLGIMELLKRYDISLSGKNVVVIGRSNIVGKPIANLMLQANATVTICHSQTKNLNEFTKRADIIIVAIGRANFLTADMVSDGVVVVDVGINRLDTGKVVGDVDFDAVKEKASFITPVPGGVGPMTIAMLMSNTLKAYSMQNLAR